jgi:transaldolase
VKDTRYPDTLYVDSLIGPGTIDTLPEKTLEAFIDHGQVRRTLDADLDQARRHLDELARVDIDLDRVTAELETEGVESFAKSYELLLHAVTEEAAAAGASGRP